MAQEFHPGQIARRARSTASPTTRRTPTCRTRSPSSRAGGVKDWPKRCVSWMCDGVCDHAHGREAELEAVGPEPDWPAARRTLALSHADDLRRMRNEIALPINSGESACRHNDPPRWVTVWMNRNETRMLVPPNEL